MRVRRGGTAAVIVLLLGSSLLASQAAHAAGLDMFTIAQCRAVDTRNSSVQAIPANGSSSFKIVGTLGNQGGQSACGIPVGAKAVFLNVLAISVSAAGYLSVYPYGGAIPVTSTLNFAAKQTIANGAMISLCDPTVTSCPSDLTVKMGPAAAYVVIDVTGYAQ
ncbi:MAG TPA: hypothetical protein VMS64_21235 [Candidatus Methylomirabilis sp.]|nr:hypothetical protein [Candidatus Methylomirabilis sp.]